MMVSGLGPDGVLVGSSSVETSAVSRVLPKGGFSAVSPKEMTILGVDLEVDRFRKIYVQSLNILAGRASAIDPSEIPKGARRIRPALPLLPLF